MLTEGMAALAAAAWNRSRFGGGHRAVGDIPLPGRHAPRARERRHGTDHSGAIGPHSGRTRTARSRRRLRLGVEILRRPRRGLPEEQERLAAQLQELVDRINSLQPKAGSGGIATAGPGGVAVNGPNLVEARDGGYAANVQHFGSPSENPTVPGRPQA